MRAALVGLLGTVAFAISADAQIQSVNWTHLSSAKGDLPVPPENLGQSGLRLIDLDQDGRMDYVLTLWGTYSVVWYRRVGETFQPYIIEPDILTLTHGEKFADIDGDGDIDLIFGQASAGNDIYWWENPHPNYAPTTPWTRRLVRNAGGNFYHDNIWGDFNGDGREEFVAWNQGGQQLLVFEVPADPKQPGPWPVTPIFSWTDTFTGGYRGVAATDINLDGKIDFVGGGGWFEHTGGTNFTYHPFDETMRSARQVAGQLIPGNRPEIVAVQELADGPLNLYEWTGSEWSVRTLIPNVRRSHTLELGDINGDGFLDILVGEMGQATNPPPENPAARTWILYGNGAGEFVEQLVFVGQGTLEGKLGDIDGDGDLDIIGNTFRHNAPRIDIWINEGFAPTILPAGGTFPGNVTVSLSSNAGDSIRYTTNGSDPRTGSTYTGPFTVNTNATVKAVSVANGQALAGSSSATYTITPDTTPPAIVSAYGLGGLAQVKVFFSEPLDRSTAENTANFAIDQGVTVQAATLDVNLRTVTLTTSPFQAGGAYALVVNNVRDRAAAPNIIASNSRVDFQVETVTAQGLALWLKADEGTVPNGPSLSQWRDVSGNNRHAVAPFPFSQPLLQSGAVNNYPAPAFNGVNHFLSFNLPVNGLTGMTVFLVAANTANQDGGTPQAERAAIFWNETKAWGTVYLSPFQSMVNFRFGTLQSGNRISYTRPASVGSDFTLSTAIKAGTTDSLYVNGTLAVSESGKLASIAGCTDTATLGRGLYENTYYTGALAEVLVYTRTLSTAEREAVEGYLDRKYKLTAPKPPSPPVITTQPADVTVQESSSATFSVGADGTAPLAYQWRRGGSPIAGATGTTYTLDATSQADNGAQFDVVVSNAYGTTTSAVATLTVTAEPPPPSASTFVSDDFSSGTLNANLWTFVNPVGDGSFDVLGQVLRIHVPGGVDHDVWTAGNRAPRVLQAVNNADFEVEAKFESAFTAKHQLQGFIVQQDAANFLRFDLVFDGTKVRAYSASFANGTPTKRVDTPIAAASVYYLRVGRAGSQWTYRYSYDGASWTTAGSFSHSLLVGQLGVFAGNASGSTSPAFTGIVDYVFNTASPIVPEDGGAETQGTLTVAISGNGTVAKNPDQTSYTIGQVVELTATPATGWSFTGWSGDATGTNNPLAFTISGSHSITATFVPANNTSPTISAIADQVTSEDVSKGPIAFTIGDSETAAGNLTVTGTSSNTALMPQAAIVFGGSGANRSVTLTPAANQSGTATVTVTVSDGELSASEPFLLTVNPVNDAPTLSAIADRTIDRDSSTGPIAVTVGDIDTPVDSLALSGTSSNTTLVPVANIAFGGSGANRTVTVTPAAGQTGNATITATVSDGALTTSRSFVLTVRPPGATFTSDDFSSGALNTGLWAFVNPVGDGSVDILEKRLRIHVPGGVDHDVWKSGNRAPRVMQTVDNADFEIEAKFESALTQKYQLQGVIVQQDEGNFLRFDVYFDGSGVRAYSATFTNGTPTAKANTVIATGAPYYLRVARTGSQWTYRHSYDGANWTTIASFTHGLVVSQIGLYAANASGSTSPAFTALVDYAFNTASPIDPEDPAEGVVTISITGKGTVSKAPDKASYTMGEVVNLTAAPGTGWFFTSWSGDATGTANPLAFTVSGGHAITAVFVPENNTAPTISAIANQTTNRNTTVGPIAFTVGDAETAAGQLLVTGGSSNTALVPLSGIAFGGGAADRTVSVTPAPGQSGTATITVRVSDGELSASTSFVLTVLEPSTLPGTDDFSGSALDTTLWTFVNPLGDASVTLKDGNLRIHVPGGVSHDAWRTGNYAPRVMRAFGNDDFTMEVKFVSQLQGANAMQGIVVEQDADTFLRFDVHSRGIDARFYAATLDNGSSTVSLNWGISVNDEYRLRVRRAGSTWSVDFSYDGLTWFPGPSFQRTINVNAVGIMASNTVSNPAFTAIVDYVAFDSETFSSEDGAARNVNINTTGSGSVSRRTTSAGYALGERVELTAIPQAGWRFAGWTGALTGLSNPGRLRISGNHTVTATFAQNPDGSWIDVWHGGPASFGTWGKPQSWDNVLANIADTSGVSSLSWSLNGQLQGNLTRGPNTSRLALTGDFNIEIDENHLFSGANQVTLNAAWKSGRQETYTLSINAVKGAIWSLPYAVDWSTVQKITDAVQIVDGKWDLTANGARTAEIGYDRLLAVGDMAWDDYQVEVPFTVHAIGGTRQNPAAVGVLFRWIGHVAWSSAQPRIGWHPNGAIGWFRWYQDNKGPRLEINENGGVNVITSTAKQVAIGQTYVLKMRVTTRSPAPSAEYLYQLKIWKITEAEPSGWDLEHIATTGLSSGSLLLIAHFVDATFGDFVID